MAIPVDSEQPRENTWWSAFVVDLAPHDWLISVYFTILLLGVIFGEGPRRLAAGGIVVGLATLFVVGVLVTRGAVVPRGTFANALLYRVTVFSTVFSSYFLLRIILPACTLRVVDAKLYALDLFVFRFEPAVAWDRFVTPQTVEWFAFFYFGYFFVLAVHILPFMFGARDMKMLARFATAVFFTFCGGHLLYAAVPGYGPYHYLTSTFQHPLEGGVFWEMVKATVVGAGAQKDIFPSLHTAVPSTFTLLAYRYRNDFRIFRYSWPVVGFCTSQIILATMFLRWHYLIDICAGLTLATVSVLFADRSVKWDEARRARLGLGPAWSPLVCRRSSDTPASS
jgi:hypothetical protein